ncbi:MAG TPA: TRAP transporter substrate-binding protein [Geminicoccaceae bacterium]|nr:TRAP transporter substrate-binding protein [Geminicoccaceae bacterium]
MRSSDALNRSAPAALAALALACAVEAGAADLKVRMSVESAPGAATQTMLAAFRDALKDELGDAVEIEYFDSGTLGDEIVHMEMVRAGQLDVVPIGSDAVQLDPKWAIFDMPFLFPDRETAAGVLDGEIGRQLGQSMREKAGLQVLGFGEIGFRNITNNVRPVVTPADLQGLKLRVPGSKTRILAFETLGAAPVTMNIGELYLALQQGTVDGQENPLANIRAFSWHEVQDYLSLSNHVYTPITLVMNGRRWDSLPDGQRAAVERAAATAVAESRAYGANADATLLDELRQHMEVNEIDLAAFQEASEPIWEAIAPVAGEEFTLAVVAEVGR